MAKRFTDTKKWSDPWFYQLSPKMKLVWYFLCDECDGVGVVKLNLPLMSFYMGAEVTEAEFEDAFGLRTIRLDGESIWIPSFIRFQYTTLSPKNAAHRGIMNRVITMVRDLPLDAKTTELVNQFKNSLLGSADPQPTLNRPPVKGQPTLKEEEEEEEEDKEEVEDKEKEEGGVGGDFSAPKPGRPSVASGAIQGAIQEWRETLEHFGIQRNLIPGEDLEIGRAVQRYGAANVILAFRGARKQKKSPKWDPAEFVNLNKYLDKTAFNRLVNLGAGKESAEGIDWDFVFSRKATAAT